MSWWSRIVNVFLADRLNREIDEEFEAHIEEAVKQGLDPGEARQAFGPLLRHQEESRDIRVLAWLDAARADVVFGWRQLTKAKVTTAAAVLSLALGIGACTSAFRLIDSLLLRPLPIAAPQRLYEVFRLQTGEDGKPGTFDGWAYPVFRQMRDAVKDQAELIAVSYAERVDLTYRSDLEMEKAHVQYVSGWMFASFGLQPSSGRLFTGKDDLAPGAHPYAVISHDYWTRRFEQDPAVIGRTVRIGQTPIEIIGVAEEGFTGTEPGTVVDIFLPAMMNSRVSRSDSTWHRTFAVLKPNVAIEPLRQRLDRISLAFERERSKGFTDLSQQGIENYLRQKVLLEAAPSGVSGTQDANRRLLLSLGVLAGLVLLIACANVANLMMAQASARAREMALRVSIGAGRWRLVQMVLVESAMLAFLAAALGGFFAWRAAPLVVSMINPPDDPARLILPADWRVFAFGLAIAACVTILFGLTPALKASAVRPLSALKGGELPHSRRRLMHALIAVQVVFCFLVLFVAGLFASTLERLSHRPTGFATDRILTLDTVAASPAASWEQVAAHLRSLPGVKQVALAGWPLLSGNGWNDNVSINGGPPSDELTYFLNVSPGWLDIMKIPLVAGRDFRPGDTYPGTAIVNDTFAKRYFPDQNPIGRSFDQPEEAGVRIHLQIVGLVRDARYRGLRGPILPIAYVPFNMIDGKGADQMIKEADFIVRSSAANPLALASTLRREVTRARSDFRVSNIRTQAEINRALTVRERLLAMLAMFFAAVALLLAGVGLYGVIDYSVLQRRRELGIRIAIGAPLMDVALEVVADVCWMVLAGGATGLLLGLLSGRYLHDLLFQVTVTDLSALALPCLTILGTSLVASIPPVIRALRIDPVTMLRLD